MMAATRRPIDTDTRRARLGAFLLLPTMLFFD